MEKQLGGLLAVGRERIRRDRVEGGLRLGNLQEIAADDTGIGGVGGQRFGTKVEFDQVMGRVFAAEAEDGDVH